MAFIKNLTENFLADEYTVVPNFYNSRNIGVGTEYIGFVKIIGNIVYGIIIINADKKYDYQGFYKDAESFFSKYNRVILLGIFVSDCPDEALLSYCRNDIEDYQAELISIKWAVDLSSSSIVVRGSQPDEVLNIDKIIKASFDKAEYSADTDLGVLQTKHREIKKSEIKSNNTYITFALIILNGIIFLISMLYDEVIKWGALDSSLIIERYQIYRIFTYMFLHGGLAHYMANSLSLYIFGSRVEKYLGRYKFLFIYIFSGICGGIASTLRGGISVGASGAVFGLMAAVFTYTKLKNRTMDGFDNYLVILFAVIGIGCGMLMPNVDNAGHIGGFAGGLIISNLLLAGDKNV